MKLSEIDLRDNYKRWKRNMGVFRAFFRSTSYVSLQTYEDFTLNEYKNEADEKVLNTILKEFKDDYFTIVDLDLKDIIDLSLKLNNEKNIKPILNINLLFNEYGLIGDKEDISKLINVGNRLENIKTDKFIMLIPYDRYKEDIDVSKVYDKLNNQYAVSFEDLPYSEFIKDLGYKGITIITKEKMKEDFKDYLENLDKDIKINIVKVDRQ
ncbi:MAG: normocyte-binding protein [Clostridiaceae bacterium]|nr:normocyte-binding protein [Clostridiaceae bacterium]